MTPAATNNDFTATERKILKDLLDPAAKIEVTVPANMEGQELYDQLAVVCKALSQMRRVTAKLTPILGRMIRLIQQNPEIYKSRGHKSFESFLSDHVQGVLGVGRSTLYAAKRLSLAFPNLDLAQYEALGPQKLLTLSRFTCQREPAHKKYLAMAEKMTIHQLREYAEVQGLIGDGSDSPAVIVIRATVEVARLFKKFINHPEVQAHYGPGPHGEILLALMDEACGANGFSCFADEKMPKGKQEPIEERLPI